MNSLERRVQRLEIGRGSNESGLLALVVNGATLAEARAMRARLWKLYPNKKLLPVPGDPSLPEMRIVFGIPAFEEFLKGSESERRDGSMSALRKALEAPNENHREPAEAP
jgi:hypothetical protein